MPGILCEHCTAACCQYIALPIDVPETRADFDDLRWYLIHAGVSIFVEDGDWYISFQTRCRHLQADYRCGIYETRPRICRAYDTDECDYHSGDYGWEQHFTSPEHLDEYLRANPPKAAGRGTRKTKPRRASLASGRRRSTTRSRPAEQPQVDRVGVPLPVLPFAPRGAGFTRQAFR
jgi:Fe-S-cluster containining protein